MRAAAVAAVLGAAVSGSALADPEADIAAVAALDTRYQAAVKANDAAAMSEILHPEMVLVVGAGTVVSRAQLIESARSRTVVYERQDEEPGSQTVRLFGPDTAVVTARLWLKYAADGKTSDRRLWFSDTYVRTRDGWKYAFGQASIALP
ncbi:MAG TPA: nuclear transport factor 2 family protein [Phenylobacterium sp.]|nr:nuclear transport factor 2 family protein [Phenylobacterium sp.]